MAPEDRIHSFYDVDTSTAVEMLALFDKTITAEVVAPIHSGMSTSNYCITAGQRKYILKIYSGNTGSIEPEMYAHLQKRIRIPSLYFYDDSRNLCPYPFAIIEYIRGETLSEYVKLNYCYPAEIAHEIGRMLSIIHKKHYPERGLLDGELCLAKSGKSTSEFIFAMLEGKPGTRLSNSVQDKLQAFIEQNGDILSRIDRDFVLCHGDMSNGNIIISNNMVYFIDFEYAMAESRYRDIGKLFRSKAPEVQQYIDESVYKMFADGYDGLPYNWLQLAKVADIPVMLGLLNVDNAPQDWVTDIEHDIIEAIS